MIDHPVKIEKLTEQRARDLRNEAQAYRLANAGRAKVMAHRRLLLALAETFIQLGLWLKRRYTAANLPRPEEVFVAWRESNGKA